MGAHRGPAAGILAPGAAGLTATLRLPGAAADTAAIVPLGGLLYAPRGPGGVHVLRDIACTP